MEDVYDFFKPSMSSEYAAVDGPLSTECYLRALDRCYARIARKNDAGFDCRSFDWAIFHQPYQKLVQKAYARLLVGPYVCVMQ
jgi:hydroxymethylglutaryl-CoA synthase